MEHDQLRTKLSAWHDGELPADLMNSVADHLRNCPECRKEVEELNRVDLLVRSLPGFEVPEEFASRVSALIAAAAEPRPVSLAGRIFAGFLQLAEVIFAMLPGQGGHDTPAMDEFGDFPPLLLSSAYFQVIGL